MVSLGVPSSPWWRNWSRRHSCRLRAATPTGVEALDERQHPRHLGGRPVAHGGDLVDGRRQVAVLVEVADDGYADLPQQLVVRTRRELPHEVVGDRLRILGRGRGQRVLDRRQLLHLARRARAVAVVEIVAEEVLVVRIVPRFRLLGRGVGLRIGLVRRRLGVGCLLVLRRHFLQEGILHDLPVQQIGQLDGRHRQQLDRLLQRRGEDESLGEPRLEPLLDCHRRTAPRGALVILPARETSRRGSRQSRRKSAPR